MLLTFILASKQSKTQLQYSCNFILYIVNLTCLPYNSVQSVLKMFLNTVISHFTVGCTIALSLLMALPIAMVIMGE